MHVWWYWKANSIIFFYHILLVVTFQVLREIWPFNVTFRIHEIILEAWKLFFLIHWTIKHLLLINTAHYVVSSYITIFYELFIKIEKKLLMYYPLLVHFPFLVSIPHQKVKAEKRKVLRYNHYKFLFAPLS